MRLSVTRNATRNATRTATPNNSEYAGRHPSSGGERPSTGEHAAAAPSAAAPSAARQTSTLRACATVHCTRQARKRGRFCPRCNTAQWRARHKTALAQREARRTWTAEQMLARRALGYLSAYLRRNNEINREPCHCGQPGLPYQPDHTKPLDVEWLCRDHRQAAREQASEALADARAVAEQAAKHAAYRDERERFLNAWPLLPPERREAIRDAVRRHPWGRRISEESPLWIQLASSTFKSGI